MRELHLIALELDPDDPVDLLSPDELQEAGLLDEAVRSSGDGLRRMVQVQREATALYRVACERHEALVRRREGADG